MNLTQNAQQHLGQKNFPQAQNIAQQILKDNPNSFDGWLILSIACQNLAQYNEALSAINKVLLLNPSFDMGHLIKIQVLRSLQKKTLAITACQEALKVSQENPQIWFEYSNLLYSMHNQQEADEAFKQHLIYSAHTTNLQFALKDFFANDLPSSEKRVRQHLQQKPQDSSAIRLLGEIALNLGVYEGAQRLFEKALSISPKYHLARLNYAQTLNKRELNSSALIQIEQLEKFQPKHPPVLIVKAVILAKLARYQEAIDLYISLLTKQSNQAGLWTSLGHTYKTTGETDKAIDAYTKATIHNPEYGDAYWSLANLKTYEFSAEQIAQMELAYDNLKAKQDENLAQICFALGKAYESQSNVERSFHFYKLGNDIKKTIEPYFREEVESLIQRNKDFFSQRTFKSKENTAKDNSTKDNSIIENTTEIPIFIVGLPRSGSTLLEQILSSHSQVDGTKELPDIITIARQLGNRKKKDDKDLYPFSINDLTEQQCLEIGAKYIKNSAHLRNGAKYFIDKMPNNFLHIGLIKTILPQAKIIDARRLAASSGFSCFKQLFANGQSFSNDINDIAHYYNAYLGAMDFWKETYPQDIITMQYEDVIADTEQSVRNLLSFIGLEFEASCLSFYENKRAVATPSAEQVRQPINNKGLTAWQPYSQYLQPLISLTNNDAITV
jgi:tetratricopeptide (TPR) repeat protein